MGCQERLVSLAAAASVAPAFRGPLIRLDVAVLA
jgi:hypothetical protein